MKEEAGKSNEFFQAGPPMFWFFRLTPPVPSLRCFENLQPLYCPWQIFLSARVANFYGMGLVSYLFLHHADRSAAVNPRQR